MTRAWRFFLVIRFFPDIPAGESLSSRKWGAGICHSREGGNPDVVPTQVGIQAFLSWIPDQVRNDDIEKLLLKYHVKILWNSVRVPEFSNLGKSAAILRFC
jgi:hypothetical protein